jgi:fructan beta-fructosidase
MKKWIYFFIPLLLTSYGCLKKIMLIKRNEPNRPQIHFSPPAKWMNDPNGMVFYEGEYHLFYQYYPNGTVWGPMHWGHAISQDLIHWQDLPIALYPDSLGYIFSGSAVIDWKNTSGLGKNGVPPMIAVYTYHDSVGEKAGKDDFQTQGLAYSLDKGRTWTKYSKNPILPNPHLRDFRDPKVIWSETYQKWIMILAVADHVNIYSSNNLLTWQFLSEFGKNHGSHEGIWECPDLFPMRVKGSNTEKWVMLVSVNNGSPNGGSGTQYFVGDFDGKSFHTNQNGVKWIDYGKDNYAGITWSDIPPKDGRRLFLGWLNNWQYAQEVPTEGWRSAMTLPRSLELEKIANDFWLKSRVVAEFNQLVISDKTLINKVLKGNLAVETNQNLPLEIILNFDTKTHAKRCGLMLSNDKGEKVLIGYNFEKQYFYIDNQQNGWESPKKEFAKLITAPHQHKGDTLEMRLILDRTSVELFAADDLIVMTNQFFPTKPFHKITLFSEEGSITLKKYNIKKLKSIWR